jgi:hypothetical protein
VCIHHTESLLDPQAERTSHTPSDMAAQGPEATRHGAPYLASTLVDALAHLEGRLLQKPQLLLGGVVSRLEHRALPPASPTPRELSAGLGEKRGWIESKSQQNQSINKGLRGQLTFDLLLLLFEVHA